MVVVVDHAAVDLPGIDGFHYRTVAAIGGEVGFHPLEPCQCGRFALEFQHGADNGLEIGTGRGGTPAAFPARRGEVHQGFGQLGLGQFAGVVDKHRGARGNTDPAPMGRAIGGRHLLQGGRWHGCEQTGVIHQHHGRRVFGQEHIGRRGGPFLHDLVAHLGVIAVAQGDLDPGFLGETLHPGFGQAGMLGVIDHDALGAGRRLGEASRAEQQGCQQC
ncbi:hypothetical protein D3C81_1580170 [compost metagenome]